jgi:hypothetical protein
MQCTYYITRTTRTRKPGDDGFAWISTCQPKHQAEIHYKQYVLVWKLTRIWRKQELLFLDSVTTSGQTVLLVKKRHIIFYAQQTCYGGHSLNSRRTQHPGKNWNPGLRDWTLRTRRKSVEKREPNLTRLTHTLAYQNLIRILRIGGFRYVQ